MGHAKETGKTGMGSKKRWNGSTPDKSSSSGPFKPRFSTLKKVSKKQRNRINSLKVKMAEIQAIQLKLYGKVFCWAGYHEVKQTCSGPLVVDHVLTRNEENADGYWNLQLLCFHHNGIKGSSRIELRSPEMIAAMIELDKGGSDAQAPQAG